jgi:hypothetical protein
MEYEDIEYCIADGGEKERERERESERYLSIYSMGDYPNVGCHLTSPTKGEAQIVIALNRQLILTVCAS